MTNLEALKANVSQVHGIVISDNAFAKALLDEEISETAAYSKTEYERAVDLATIRIYVQILGAAGLSEGDVSYSPVQVNAIKACIDKLLVKCGLNPEYGTRPTISRVNPW